MLQEKVQRSNVSSEKFSEFATDLLNDLYRSCQGQKVVVVGNYLVDGDSLSAGCQMVYLLRHHDCDVHYYIADLPGNAHYKQAACKYVASDYFCNEQQMREATVLIVVDDAVDPVRLGLTAFPCKTIWQFDHHRSNATVDDWVAGEIYRLDHYKVVGNLPSAIALIIELMYRGSNTPSIQLSFFGMWTDTGGLLYESRQTINAMYHWKEILLSNSLDTERDMIDTLTPPEDIEALKWFLQSEIHLKKWNNLGVAIVAGDGISAGYLPLLSMLGKFACFIVFYDSATGKGSVRCKPGLPVNALELAKLWGGGGHECAAGFSTPNKMYVVDKASAYLSKKLKGIKGVHSFG